MILIAYLTLVASVVAWSRDNRLRTWIMFADPRMTTGLRVMAMVLAGVSVFSGVLLVRANEGRDVMPMSVGAAMVTGGVLFSLGVAFWTGRRACTLRIGGWLVLAGALSVPSTLTLGLVVVAPLIFLLEEVPPAGGRH